MPVQNRQVFIVRIWRERREVAGQPPEWRGEIESLHSGERRYVKSLAEILAFIGPFLKEMGVRVEIQ